MNDKTKTALNANRYIIYANGYIVSAAYRVISIISSLSEIFSACIKFGIIKIHECSIFVSSFPGAGSMKYGHTAAENHCINVLARNGVHDVLVLYVDLADTNEEVMNSIYGSISKSGGRV